MTLEVEFADSFRHLIQDLAALDFELLGECVHADRFGDLRHDRFVGVASAATSSASSASAFPATAGAFTRRLVVVGACSPFRGLRAFVLVLVLVEPTRERDRHDVRRWRLAATTTTTAATAAGFDRLFVHLRQFGREGLGIRGLRLRHGGQAEIAAPFVVEVDVEPIARNLIGDAHVDSSVPFPLQRVDPSSVVREDRAGHPESADDLDPSDLVDGEIASRLAARVRSDGVGIANLADTLADPAHREVLASDARPDALPGHLHESELADGQERGPRTIRGEVLGKALLDLLAISRESHVDEVADDESALVAQSQLPRDLVDGFPIRRDRIALRVPGSPAATRIDVDGDHGLGLIDDQGASRLQRHFAGMDEFDLTFDSEGLEERDRLVIVSDDRTGLRCDHLEEARRSLESRFAVDDDRPDRLVDDVANGSDDEIALGVELARSADLRHALLKLAPHPLEVGDVPLQFGLRLVVAGGPEDESEPIRKIQGVQDLPHVLSLLVVDLSTHADSVHARHHDHQPAGDREIAGDGGALGSDALLEDLNQDLLSLLEGVLNRRTLASRRLPADLLDLVRTREVPRMQIRHVKETVHALSVIDECRLDGGFDVDHACLVDVSDRGAVLSSLDEELFESPVLGDRDPA